MPRTLRMISPDHVFHVVNRGNNKQDIFQDGADFHAFIRLLILYKRKLHILIHHYVLMPNHIHLLLQPTQKAEDVSRFMQRLTLSHARTTNNRLQRTGHVWQGRFFCSSVTDDAYFLQCALYIESNAARAGFVNHPRDYPWSSFRAYALGESNPLIDVHPLISSLGSDPLSRRREYARLIDLNLAEWRAKMRT